MLKTHLPVLLICSFMAACGGGGGSSGGGGSGSGASNNAPVANPDTATTAANTPLVVHVLANDSDSDGTLDPSSVMVTSAPSNGATNVNATTGAITYTPGTDYQGSDSFAYRIADDDGSMSSSATVSISVVAGNAPPAAVDDSATLNQGSSISVDVLANDSDPDGSLNPASVSVSIGPNNGATTINASTGEITYTPNGGFSGSDSLTYTVADDDGAISNDATVSLTVNPINTNSPPTAVDDSATLDEDASATIDVLANDSDPDGTLDPSSVTVTSGPSNGTTSINGSTGAVTYTPDADFNGTDSFTYTVSDNEGATSAQATVSLSVDAVNDAPVAADDSATLDEDTSVTVDVLANDNDPDGSLDPGTITITTAASNGATSINSVTGAITYTPNADFNGTDSLVYTVVDSDGAPSNAATLTLTVSPVNDAPQAIDDTATLDEDGSVVVDVLANDSDVDGTLDPTTVTLQAAPSNGAATVNASTGLITYTPYPDYVGEDNLSYTVSDNEGATSEPATANLTVRPSVYNLSVRAGSNPKELTFEWESSINPDHYRLQVNPDGNSGFTTVNGAENISGTIYTTTEPVHLTDWANAMYRVVAMDNSDNVLSGSPEISLLNSVNAEDVVGYFKASNTDSDDYFGESVAMSDSGDTLAVGASLEDSSAKFTDGDDSDNSASDAGAVYVFTRNNGTWSQQAYIKASNTDSGDRFGTNLSLSSSGDTLAVVANSEDSSATGINGAHNDNGASFSGAVYVFTRNNGTWSQQAYIKASNTDSGDRFGRSVALSDTGDTLAVGAPSEDSAATDIDGLQADNGASDAGAVYVYTRTSGAWSQQAYVKASNTDSGDYFGISVALSDTGDTLAVGAFNEDSAATGINGIQGDNSAALSGAVYVFARTNEIWSQQAYIKASNTDSGDRFGSSLSLSETGDTLAVGAHEEGSVATGINGNQSDNSAARAGAVYVFTRSGSIWSQEVYVKASNTDSEDRFGSSLSLSETGDTLAVGAYYEKSLATGINGYQNGNSSLAQAGAVYVFIRTSGTWSQQAYVKASNTDYKDRFGFDLSLSSSGDTLAVGAWGEESSAIGINSDQNNNSAPRAGAVYLY